MDTVRCPTDRNPTTCAVLIGHALEVIGNKWTVPIVLTLTQAKGPVRFTEIGRAIPQITQKELTKRLRELEASGVVARKVYPVVPPRVEYRLTELGRSLQPILGAMARWAGEHGVTIAENRAAYAERRAEEAA